MNPHNPRAGLDACKARGRRRARRAWLAFAWLFAALPPPAAQALRPPGLYQATVSVPAGGTVPDAALQEALRGVLVRVTGTRDAASDPALMTLVNDARRYLQGYRQLGNGSVEITFDGASLERALNDAGKRAWNPDRPLMLVLLRPVPAAEQLEDAAQLMREIADARGLPISLALGRNLAVEGAAGERDSLLPAAQRLGGNAVLLGRADSGANASSWHWSLYSAAPTQTWSGTLEQGAQGAADALARADLQAQVEPELRVTLQVLDVRSIADYAAVLAALSGLPGARGVSVEEARGDGTLGLRIFARAGASFSAALAGAGILEPVDAGAGVAVAAGDMGRYRMRR